MKTYIANPVVAKQNYCVPAVLEMVLMHYGIKNYSQDAIADQLTIVSDNDNSNQAQWGTQITNNTLNDFFHNNNIPLAEEYIPVNQFFDEVFMGEEINNMLGRNISIICGYNYSWLFGNRDCKFRHVSIIVDYYIDSNTFLMLDPGPKEAGYKIVDAYRLFEAIRAAKDGLWCIYSM